MQDPLDVGIEDPELEQEIQLLSDLMVLASRLEGRDADAVDAILLKSDVPHQRDNGIGGAAR